MTQKRHLALICLLCAIALVVGGCGNTTTPAATTGSAATAAAEKTAAPKADDTSDDQATAAEPEANKYAEPVHFTYANLGDDTMDYVSDIIYKEYSETFNFTWDVYSMVWDNWAEKCRLWINAGDMPDILVWNYTFAEYLQYAEAGMLGALPQGWEERYPTLADCQVKTGVKEYVTLNGTQYILPRVTFYHFAPVNTILYHGSLIYRKDWLKKLGMGPWEDGSMITLDQMKEYLGAAINNNPDGLPASSVTGLTDTYGLVCRLLVSMGDEGYNTFYKQDGQYIWGPTSHGTIDGMKLLREMYNDGYIDPDFYMITDKVHGDKFNAGTAAMYFDDMTAGTLNNVFKNFGTANPDLGDPFENVGLVNVLGPDGKWHGTQDPNNWSAVVFSPNNDSVKMERALAIFDYSATLEQQEKLRMGIEGVDYIKHGKNDYELIRPKNEDGTYPALNTIYPSTSMLNGFVILGDDFSFANPATQSRVKEITALQYQNKEKVGKLLPYDYDFVFYTSPAKSNYSGSLINDEIVRIVVGNNDIESEWQKFIDSQMPIVQPLLDELNTIVLK